MALSFRERRISSSARSRFVRLYSTLASPYREAFDAVVNAAGGLEAYFDSPASRQGHHAWPGGLLAHSVEVGELSKSAAEIIGTERINVDFLLLLALLHDVGKVEEYRRTKRGISMSDTGHWVGHKVMGHLAVGAASEALRQLDRRLLLALVNGLSGAEGVPVAAQRGLASLEATIVNRMDQISAASDLYKGSQRITGRTNFYGVKHAHLREQPLHPVALK
jgi:putative nucleotidyltransferase with HDIG domain